MIQIICCSCTQQKLRGNGVDFYSNKRFYQNIEEIFVAHCSRHPFFKERIGSHFIDVTCNNLNVLVDKIKIARFRDVPAEVKIKTIEKYLSDIKSELFFYFCRGYFKVQCSLDNPKYISLISLISLKFIILRMKSLFLSAVLIILWKVCVSILIIVSTIPEGFFSNETR